MIDLVPSWLYETLAVIGGACVLCCAIIVAWSVWERATWEEPAPKIPEPKRNVIVLDNAKLARRFLSPAASQREGKP